MADSANHRPDKHHHNRDSNSLPGGGGDTFNGPISRGIVGGRNNANAVYNGESEDSIDNKLERIQGMVATIDEERAHGVLSELIRIRKRLGTMVAKQNTLEQQIRQKLDLVRE